MAAGAVGSRFPMSSECDRPVSSCLEENDARGAAKVSRSGTEQGSLDPFEVGSMGATLTYRQGDYAPAVYDWGYASMHCAYGYQKDESGYCRPKEWYDTSYGCYETTLIHRKRPPARPSISSLAYLRAETTSIIEQCHPSTVVEYGMSDVAGLLALGR